LINNHIQPYLLNNPGNFTIEEKNSNVGAGFIPARNAIYAAIQAGINPAPTKNSPQIIEMLHPTHLNQEYNLKNYSSVSTAIEKLRIKSESNYHRM
jgi:hypothetical protein